jgi:hypothetical protein
VQVWDVWNVGEGRRIKKVRSHSARVSALSWNGDITCLGCHDGFILHDVRAPSPPVERRLVVGHTKEVSRR